MSDSFSSKKMLFVVGNSRSGTTMLGRILGHATDVYTFNELHFFEQMWHPHVPPQHVTTAQAVAMFARLIGIQRNGYYFKQMDIQKYRLEAQAAINTLPEPMDPAIVYAAFVSYETGRLGKAISCDQTPRNLYYLQEILNLYPNAIVVNILRDPRGVLLSQKNRWHRRSMSNGGVPLFHTVRQWADYHPVTISLIWKQGINSYDRVAKHPRVIGLRFEDLLENPEFEIKRLCQFAGIQYVPDMLDIPQVGSSLERDNPDLRGINREAAERWRQGGLTTSEIWICQRLTKTAMQRHSYKLELVTPHVTAIVWAWVTWLVKGGLALLFNLHRSRNPLTAVSRRLGLSRNRE
jgi:hypothetical protein